MIGCDSFFYYPDQKVRGHPGDDGLACEDVFFGAPGGPRLHGWFLPARGGEPRGTVLHLHGNAANVTGHYEFIRWLPAAGYHVLTFDYRGYGRSQGRVSRRGTLEDAAAALDYLQGRGDVDSRRVIVFGQSIGGVVAVVLAGGRRDRIRAVVVDSAFTRYRDIARYHVHQSVTLFALAWWFPRCVRIGFDAIDHVSRIAPTPVLFMHGRADRIAPAFMSRQLYEAAGDPKELWLIDEMDHTEIWWQRPEAAQSRFLSFVEQATLR